MAPPDSQEVELKLLVEPDDLERLWQHPRAVELTRGTASIRELESVYFDTPDLDLARANLVLRLRNDEGHTLQTVKERTPGLAGLFRRGEWEVQISGEKPDLERIPDAALRKRLKAAVGRNELARVLETRVRRSHRTVGDAEWEARFDLDVGEAKTPRGSYSICELELELVHGDAGALYDLALEIDQTVPLRPSAVGKVERGLAALLGESPEARFGKRPVLAADASLEDAIAATVTACIEQITGNAPVVKQGVDPEGVHQMRVGVRRLRSALSLFREVIPSEERAYFRRELRWLGSELGDARDFDVLLAERIEPLLLAVPHRGDLARLAEAVREIRGKGYDRARAAQESHRYTRLLLALGAWTAGRRWCAQPLTPRAAQLFAPAREIGKQLLDRRYQEVRRHGAHIGRLSEQKAHRLRIEIKKLRYASEFLGGLFDDRRRPRFVRQLKQLQDELGKLNDQANVDGLLDRALARLEPETAAENQRAAGFVAGWSAQAGREGLAPLGKHWRRFTKHAPFWSDGE
jgi:triphosphatase